MAGQIWATNSLGGYMYSDNLSNTLRIAMQPLMRFRQQCSLESAVGKNKGQTFNWNIYSKVKTKGGRIGEQDIMPETNFDITQGSMTIYQFGNSIPYTGLLNDLSQHPIESIINKVVKNDANDVMETEAHQQFDNTLLTVTPESGTSTTAITVEVTGTPTATNNVALGKTHVKLIVDEMKERNIPAADGSNYMAIGRPTALRNLKDDLEAISQYVQEGFGSIMNGEVGRSYDGVRFLEQTGVASEGWTNAKSDAVYFFGDDTVTEGMAVPEEIRGKIPTNYGLSKGIAWYALGGFAIIHNQAGAEQNRILKWASAA
jgi:N4-gp56 family major capsid protein